MQLELHGACLLQCMKGLQTSGQDVLLCPCLQQALQWCVQDTMLASGAGTFQHDFGKVVALQSQGFIFFHHPKILHLLSDFLRFQGFVLQQFFFLDDNIFFLVLHHNSHWLFNLNGRFLLGLLNHQDRLGFCTG